MKSIGSGVAGIAGSTFVFGLLITGCVSVQNVDRSLVDRASPDVGVVSVAELGEKMVARQNYEAMRGRKVPDPSRTTNGPFPIDMGGMYVRINDGQHYCGMITQRDPLNYGKQMRVCFSDQEFKDKGIPYEEGEEVVVKPGSFQAVLEYSGRSGNTISIFYKEFTETRDGAFIRPAFTQEFKFDLSESKMIGVKGARIEIIEATNQSIKFRVLSHFTRS